MCRIGSWVLRAERVIFLWINKSIDRNKKKWLYLSKYFLLFLPKWAKTDI